MYLYSILISISERTSMEIEFTWKWEKGKKKNLKIEFNAKN